MEHLLCYRFARVVKGTIAIDAEARQETTCNRHARPHRCAPFTGIHPRPDRHDPCDDAASSRARERSARGADRGKGMKGFHRSRLYRRLRGTPVAREFRPLPAAPASTAPAVAMAPISVRRRRHATRADGIACGRSGRRFDVYKLTNCIQDAQDSTIEPSVDRARRRGNAACRAADGTENGGI